MLFLYTDFGLEGPYVGQMRAAIAREAPSLQPIDLCHDLPAFNARAAASLLSALVIHLPSDAVVVGVVDPGVGSDRRAVVLEADGRRYVGPDNGLFSQVARRAEKAVWYNLDWTPPGMSASFHGRDLFAPAGARMADWRPLPLTPVTEMPYGMDWPQHLPEIVYTDHFGNAMTGLRANDFPPGGTLRFAEWEIPRARTFSDVPAGAPLCYENSIGLMEIAVNQGSARELLGLEAGSGVTVVGRTS